MKRPIKDWDCQKPGQDHDLITTSQSWAEIVQECIRCGAVYVSGFGG